MVSIYNPYEQGSTAWNIRYGEINANLRANDAAYAQREFDKAKRKEEHRQWKAQRKAWEAEHPEEAQQQREEAARHAQEARARRIEVVSACPCGSLRIEADVLRHMYFNSQRMFGYGDPVLDCTPELRSALDALSPKQQQKIIHYYEVMHLANDNLCSQHLFEAAAKWAPGTHQLIQGLPEEWHQAIRRESPPASMGCGHACLVFWGLCCCCWYLWGWCSSKD